jgi:hypothetical protein
MSEFKLSGDVATCVETRLALLFEAREDSDVVTNALESTKVEDRTYRDLSISEIDVVNEYSALKEV